MRIASSKVTNQGQISVPAEVRKALGIRAGTELIWDQNENGDNIQAPAIRESALKTWRRSKADSAGCFILETVIAASESPLGSGEGSRWTRRLGRPVLRWLH